MPEQKEKAAQCEAAIKAESKCSVCGNERIKENHNYCGVCGSQLKVNQVIPEEKLNWLKKVEAKEFERPMKYCIHNWVFSEEYLRNTSLEKLEEMYQSIWLDKPDYKVE